jgi:DNA-binding transcriptional LysR family regulator
MNLRSVDLNLLVALEALLQERHVSRAALRVGLSQPAMSAALARLRESFGDVLLVRTPAGMELTDRARTLIGPVDSRFVDDVLARLGARRHVALNVPHWLVVPEVLRATDLVAVMPERLARLAAAPEDGFALRDLPLESARFDWALYWHRRREGSAEHAWLRRLLVTAVRASPGVVTRRRAAPPRRSGSRPAG